jgi:hypothetical protein
MPMSAGLDIDEVWRYPDITGAVELFLAMLHLVDCSTACRMSFSLSALQVGRWQIFVCMNNYSMASAM